VPTLQRIAGTSTGRLLHDRAHGIDPRRVTPAGPPASIAASRHFDHDVLDPDERRRALLALATDLGTRLRADERTARAIELQVTYADRSHTTRSRTLAEPTSHTPALRDALYGIHTALGLERARVRAMTARVAQLAPAARAYVQLTFDRATENHRSLEPVLDKANTRYGTHTLRPATLTTPTGRSPHARGGR
jgi:DNA polymerase-4